jgi:hypothetical protein
MGTKPHILIKTWLEIYYNKNRQWYKKAQSAVAVEKLIFEYFNSVYEAEMYLFKLGQAK